MTRHTTGLDGFRCRRIGPVSLYLGGASMGRGPVVNPFPVLNRRPNAHHNPMQPWPRHRTGLYRRRQPQTLPRDIPDGLFNDLFAKMRSDRDRALLAMFVSAGPRAEELLGLVRSRVNVGDQLIEVIRKGSRALQWLPVSPCTFVWLRLDPSPRPEGPSDSADRRTRRRNPWHEPPQPPTAALRRFDRALCGGQSMPRLGEVRQPAERNSSHAHGNAGAWRRPAIRRPPL